MNRAAALLFTFVFAMSLSASADEGLWLVGDVHGTLESRMKERGLLLSAAQIHNPEGSGAAVSDAVVRMGSGYTGSLISEDGLILTS